MQIKKAIAGLTFGHADYIIGRDTRGLFGLPPVAGFGIVSRQQGLSAAPFRAMSEKEGLAESAQSNCLMPGLFNGIAK
jgi:hypothetical protein